MRLRYTNHRTVLTLDGFQHLQLKIRRCENKACSCRHVAYRPEAEGFIALPHHEFGLDVMALIGALRHREHRSVPEIHKELERRGLLICERSVTNLLDRYDEVVATRLAGPTLDGLAAQGRVILGLDGLQPDVGHEVLWVIRDCLSGRVLLARPMLSSTGGDLAGLLREVVAKLPVPVAGVVSDGQHSIRQAVASALPGVPHQLCHFHFLREAARPLFEADRHAKKLLRKALRGVRPIERALESREGAEAEITAGYCAAVRSALTDDGHPPLAAPGVTLQRRMQAIAHSLDRVAEKGG